VPLTVQIFFHPSSPWGEHEIDYVLFFCVKSKDELTVQPHPDEVDAVKWVTRQQLIDMMEDPKLLFSPWFRLICKKWLLDLWWKDLTATMTTDKYCDFANIHCFDPPKGMSWLTAFHHCYHANDVVPLFAHRLTRLLFFLFAEHLGGGGKAGLLFEGDAEGDTR
jgi:NUDIX domain